MVSRQIHIGCLVFMLVIMFHCTVYSEFIELNNLDPIIVKYLKKQAEEFEVDSSSISVNKLFRIDVDRDGDKDVFIDYSLTNIGGGNYCQFFFALFENKNNKLKLCSDIGNGSFGTAFGTNLLTKYVKNNKIVCVSYSYTDGDGVCCPSIRSNAYIIFENKKIKIISSKKTYTTILLDKLNTDYLNDKIVIFNNGNNKIIQIQNEKHKLIEYLNIKFTKKTILSDFFLKEINGDDYLFFHAEDNNWSSDYAWELNNHSKKDYYYKSVNKFDKSAPALQNLSSDSSVNEWLSSYRNN